MFLHSTEEKQPHNHWTNLRVSIAGIRIVIVPRVTHMILRVSRIGMSHRHPVSQRLSVCVAQRMTHGTVAPRTVPPVHDYLTGRGAMADLRRFWMLKSIMTWHETDRNYFWAQNPLNLPNQLNIYLWYLFANFCGTSRKLNPEIGWNRRRWKKTIVYC